MKRILCTFSALLCLAAASHGAAITIQAYTYNGFSDQTGADLAAGNQVRVGTFTLSDSQILADALLGPAGYALLGQNFVQFGAAHIGTDGTGAAVPAGLFQSPSIVNSSSDSLGLANAQVYLWAFKTATNTDPLPDFSNVTAVGVFWLDQTAVGGQRWRFRPQAEVPNSSLVDIADLTTDQANGSNTLRSGAHIAAGTFPGGTSGTGNGAKDFGLIASPEPSSAALLIVGAMGLLQRRRRNS